MKKHLYKQLQTECQQNQLINLGWNNDLTNLLSIYNYFSNTNKNNLSFLYENDGEFFYNDLPCFYRSNFVTNEIKFFDNILMIGTNPRYENSSIHLNLRNMANESPVNIYSINSFNNLTFRNKTLSSSNKYMVNIFQGKAKFLKTFFKNKKNLTIFGANMINNKYKNNATFQNQFLNLKLYNFNNSKNAFLLLSANLTSLINNEFNLFQTSNNLNNYGLINKINLKQDVIYLQNNTIEPINNLKITNSFIFNYFNTKKTNTSKKLNILNKKKYINIINNYEKNSLIYNFSGVLLKSPKIIYKQSNIKKNLSNLATEKFLLNFLNNNLFNSINNLYIYKNKKNLNKNWISKQFNKTLNFENLFDSTLLNNYFDKNINKKFFNFWWFINKAKTSSRFYFFNYNNSIKNYYLTDSFCNNSYTMLLLSLLKTRYNETFPLIRKN